jgi:hypothetical protein
MRSAGGPVRRAIVAASLALALGLALGGCGAGYSAETATSLQHGVLEVATAAHTNDLAGAQTKLAALAKLNDTALAKGEISSARHAAINTSILAVRADLTQLQDQAEKARLQQQLQELQQQQQQDQKDKGHGKGKSGQGGDG